MRLTRLCAALAAAGFAACASSTPEHAAIAREHAAIAREHAAVAREHAAAAPPVLDALLGERLVVPLAELPLRVPLAADQDFRVERLGASEHTSHHVGAIRSAEPLHRHDRHDLLVLIVRGRGTQRVGDETRAVGEGSLLFVPRGVVHAFTNTGPEPAIAVLVYSPPFDGSDRVLVEAR